MNNTGKIVDNLFLNPLENKLSTMLPVFHDKASGGSSGSPLSSGDSSVVRSPDSWFERSCVRVPAGAEGVCSSPGSTFCADLFGYYSTPVLPQQHVNKSSLILPEVQVTGYS